MTSENLLKIIKEARQAIDEYKQGEMLKESTYGATIHKLDRILHESEIQNQTKGLLKEAYLLLPPESGVCPVCGR